MPKLTTQTFVEIFDETKTIGNVEIKRTGEFMPLVQTIRSQVIGI